MGNPTSSLARLSTALVGFALIGLVVFGAERLIEASDPDLLWRDPVSGDDGLKFYRFDPVLGLAHKPGFAAEYRGITYEINRLGVRGPELSYARTPGKRRLLVLGDSLVWGFGVAQGETVCDALSDFLPGAEVVNLGVAGYGTGQELMLLQHEGLRYEPDHVVLVFTLANDIEDSFFPDSAASYPANLFYLEGGALRIDRFETTRIERLGLWLAHHSYLVNYLARSVREGQHPDAGQRTSEASAIGRANRMRLEMLTPDLADYARLAYLARPEAGSAPVRYAKRGGPLRPDALNHYKVELAKQLLLEVAHVSRARGADFSVALAPYAAEFEQQRRDPLSIELTRFLREAGVEVIDLLPMLREKRIPQAQLYTDALHFSPRGSRIVAELLSAALDPPSSG